MSSTKQAENKATVARTQNSIRWLDGEENLGLNPGSVGASSPLANGGTVITKQIGSNH